MEDYVSWKQNQQDNWYDMLKNVMKENNDKGLVKCTLSKEEMKENFDNYYGSCGGQEFNAWTEDYVYFSDEYDGLKRVKYVRRNPIKMENK